VSWLDSLQLGNTIFNRLRPNSYQQNRTPYQRMKHAGIESKTAENVCLWTVTILDDSTYKHFNFNLPQGGYHVSLFDDATSFITCILCQFVR